MSFNSRLRPAWLGAALCLIVLAGAAPAHADAPATVTVRAVGIDGQTVLPSTTVTTNTNAIPVPADKPGDPSGTCSGTSAGGALYDAVNGDWSGEFDDGDTFVAGIDGVDYPLTSPDAYWSFWYNGTEPPTGACDVQLSTGDHVTFIAACYATGPDCTSDDIPATVLTLAPSSTTLQLGTPLTVTVGADNNSGTPESPLPGGLTVTAGALSATPNAAGSATLTFPAVGTYTVQATAPGAIASDQYTVCVHNGNDGNCGTTAPPAPTAPATTTVSTSTSTTASAGVQGTTTKVPPRPVALAAFATGVINSRVYSRGDAPRTLAGHVTANGALQAVRIRLERNDDGRCSDYDGTTERFRANRCGIGRASFFKVGDEATFSYLLPAALGPGRYVFDVEAVDANGHVSGLYHGTSRIVFYVR